MTTENLQGIEAIAQAMSVEKIGGLDKSFETSPAKLAGAQQVTFGQMVSQGLQQVNQQLSTTQTDLQQLALGDVQNLHQIMIRMEDSRISFQLLLQVRNRLLEAYQDVMKMSI